MDKRMRAVYFYRFLSCNSNSVAFDTKSKQIYMYVQLKWYKYYVSVTREVWKYKN